MEVGTRSPTESSDIQQKIVMMAIHEESSKFGIVKQMGWGCAQEVSAFQRQERDFRQKTLKESREVDSRHTPPPNTWFPSYSKPGGATMRTARGEGGRHRGEGWHVRRGAEQPAQQEHWHQPESAHVCSSILTRALWRTPAPAPAGPHAVSCFLPPPLPRLPLLPRPLLLFLWKSR